MKKIIAFVSMLMIISLLAACGGETSTEEKPVEKVESSQDNGTEDVSKEESDVKELNQQVADSENIKATLVSVEKKTDEIWGDFIEVTFEVENKRDDTIEVQAREVSADGKMVDESMLTMSTEIAPGKTADCVLTIQPIEEGDELPPMEENLEMVLNVFSWDSDFEENHNVKIEF